MSAEHPLQSKGHAVRLRWLQSHLFFSFISLNSFSRPCSSSFLSDLSCRALNSRGAGLDSQLPNSHSDAANAAQSRAFSLAWRNVGGRRPESIVAERNISCSSSDRRAGTVEGRVATAMATRLTRPPDRHEDEFCSEHSARCRKRSR